MARTRRLSDQAVAVVRALGAAPAEWRYGYDLCREVGLKAGSMYPILIRLADRGLLETTWESDVTPGRPPRHLYRLSGPGRALATDLATEAEPTVARPAAASPGPRLRLSGEGT
ncbi:MAG TPA: PadR family transcriptional regulator [Acidimicrobiales bacterium]